MGSHPAPCHGCLLLTACASYGLAPYARSRVPLPAACAGYGIAPYAWSRAQALPAARAGHKLAPRALFACPARCALTPHLSTATKLSALAERSRRHQAESREEQLRTLLRLPQTAPPRCSSPAASLATPRLLAYRWQPARGFGSPRCRDTRSRGPLRRAQAPRAAALLGLPLHAIAPPAAGRAAPGRHVAAATAALPQPGGRFGLPAADPIASAYLPQIPWLATPSQPRLPPPSRTCCIAHLPSQRRGWWHRMGSLRRRSSLRRWVLYHGLLSRRSPRGSLPPLAARLQPRALAAPRGPACRRS